MSELATVEPIDKQAILDYLGLDPSKLEVQALLLMAERYALDPVIGHIVLIVNKKTGAAKPFITRDGLLHIAHRSGDLNGIVVESVTEEATEWKAVVSVHRKSMSFPFTYPGRYPKSGWNKEYQPEMSIKTAESHALRRAFDIALPSVEERWDDGLAEPEPVLSRDNMVELHARVAALPPDLREHVAEFIRSTGATSRKVSLPQAAQIFEELEDAEALAMDIVHAEEERQRAEGAWPMGDLRTDAEKATLVVEDETDPPALPLEDDK